jgi:hypothetical protein
LSLGVLLYLGAQNYLNKNLSEFVSKKSEGKYELTFETIEISFKHWGIELKQVSFHPTDSIIRSLEQGSLSKQFYSFASPNIHFGDIHLLQLVFQRKLEIGEILITRPELHIHGSKISESEGKNNVSSLFQELKPLVTKKFSSIHIHKIELAQASFDFYNLLGDSRRLANAENITIGILNFYTDSVLLPNPDRMFDADDIYLRMQNYQNKLADSIHSLSAETATYSLKRSQIEAQNIELKPIDQETVKSKYSIQVPYARITSPHIKDFYQSNSIPIDSLQLTDAKIKYWPGRKALKNKSGGPVGFDLYELIRRDFSSVSIHDFELKSAQLLLYRSQTDLSSQQELKNINLKLNSFQLDSLSNQDTSLVFYSKNIDFSASEYELTLGDNIHRVRAGYLNLSTHKRSVFVKNIQLYPLQTTSSVSPKNTIDASCDSIRLDQFDFKKAFHQNRFAFQQINLFNPEVRLTQNKIAKENEVHENLSFAYQLISNYIKGIYASQVFVSKGKIQLVNKTGALQTGNIESGIRLQLSGFALDEVSSRRTDRLFFANQIELNFNDYQMQLVDRLHKLTIDQLVISTRKKQARLYNLHLFPVSKENMQDLLLKYNRSELYEFSIPELSLLNADFHEAFFNKKLSVDTLRIKSPQIYYENFALLKQFKPKAEFEDLFFLLSNYLDNIYLGKVDIPDGTIRLINHNKKGKTISLDNHFSLGLENTLVNQDQFGRKKLLFSEFVDFSVRDHLIRLSDNVHVLKAGEIGFSTRRKEIFVSNAQLFPETKSKDFSTITWNIQLSLPEIRIRGIDIEELYFDRKIDAENILIKSPEIKLYQKRKRIDTRDLKEISIPLPKEIESIAIRQFNLNDGSLKVFSEMGTPPYLLVQSDLKMTGTNMFIQNNPGEGNPEFKRGEYTSELFQFKFTPKDKNQQFSIEELNFSTRNRQIVAKQLVLNPKTKNTHQDQFELRIPYMSLNGFDLDKAYRNDQFLFESIALEKPSFQLYNNAKDSVKLNPFNVDFYPHVESFANVFASKSININEADLSIFKNGQKKIQEKVTFALNNLRIDNKPSRGFMHSEAFSFKIPNLRRQGKFYQFTLGDIAYSSENNRFVAHNILITPNFSKEKHQKLIGFQSDYFKGKVDSICLEQPNIRLWFEREEIIGKYFTVNGLNLDIYRDKRMSFDKNRHPKMLQDLIKSAQYPFQIDSFKLLNSTISYIERPAAGDTEGEVRFTNIEARVKPLSNIKSSAGRIPDFTLNGTATLMDSCRLETQMQYQMNHPGNQFTVNGSLSPFHMRIINPVLEPLASISIRSGKVNRFQFTFLADQNHANGHLVFGYDDFKISVLESKNGSTKESKFASFMANSLLLRSKNPRGKELLPDEINFQRDENRSILNYWWKSVFSGIRNTLGIKENKQEPQN